MVGAVLRPWHNAVASRLGSALSEKGAWLFDIEHRFQVLPIGGRVGDGAMWENRPLWKRG
jgi:hypothetical protein